MEWERSPKGASEIIMSNLCYVLDKNMFTDEDTGHWLCQDPSHHVVLTDFAMMETYSGDAFQNVPNSFSLLRHFSGQIVKMHANDHLRSLPRHGRQQDLVDWDQTEDLRLYLQGDLQGFSRLGRWALSENQKTAEETLQTITRNVTEHRHSFAGIEPQIRNLIVSRKEGIPRFGRRGVAMIKNYAVDLARGLGRLSGAPKAPTVADLVNTFEFRFAASATAILIVRVSQGSVLQLSDETSRNDTVDANYMACSTYWNGFLTRDGNTAKAYRVLNETILT
jgi:hypothetical protein